MEATPNAPCGLGGAFDGAPFERLNFCTGGIKKQLDFFLNSSDLEPFQGDDLIAVVDCMNEVRREGRRRERRRTVEPADDGFLLLPLLYDDLHMRVRACQGLDLREQVCPGVLRRDPFIAVLENKLADLGQERAVAVCWPRPQLSSEEGHVCESVLVDKRAGQVLSTRAEFESFLLLPFHDGARDAILDGRPQKEEVRRRLNPHKATAHGKCPRNNHRRSGHARRPRDRGQAGPA